MKKDQAVVRTTAQVTRKDLISSPAVDGNSSSLENHRRILNVLRDRSLSPGEAAAGKELEGLKAPYLDPILKRSKSKVCELRAALGQLRQAENDS